MNCLINEVYIFKSKIKEKFLVKNDINISYKVHNDLNYINNFYKKKLSEKGWKIMNDSSNIIEFINSDKNKYITIHIINNKSSSIVSVSLFNISYE